MSKNEEVPSKYLISKGTSFPLLTEGEEPPTVQLECYEYIINKDEDGFGYYAVCEELHAVTQGDTWKELKDNILEVHSLMLEDYD
jgi:hypothetical protein